MNTSRTPNLFATILAAFSQGLTFGFGFNQSIRDYKASQKADRHY